MYTRNEKIVPIYIEEEMKDSYINYAMSVIIGRALPDVRDGLKPVHRRILYAMKDLHLEHNKTYKKSARIVGECFVKDTFVLTDKGLAPIQDIKRGDRVYTQKGLHRVRELYEMPPKELLRVQLSNGTSNIVTPLQKFKTVNKNFELEWKEADKLTGDDHIVVKAHYPQIKRKVKLQKVHSLNPGHLNENIAYLLGIFMSEGSIEQDRHKKDAYRISISFNSREIIEKVADILLKEFDYIANVQEKGYFFQGANSESAINHQYTVRISKNYVNRFLVRNFHLAGLKSPQKNIPWQVLKSPESVIYAFISGLIDGDGSIHKSRSYVHYGSVSKVLIDRLQLLLQHLGVFGTIYGDKGCRKSHFIGTREIHSRFPFYNLEFNGINAKRLCSGIVLYDWAKNARAARVREKGLKKSAFEIIPYAGEKVFGELSGKHIGSGWYASKSGEKFRAGVKYGTECKIRYSKELKEKPLRKSQIVEWGIKEKLEKIDSPLCDFINHVIQDNIYFMKVSSVTPVGPQPTYDIQVEGEHEFVANGMISHNCLGKYHPHGDMAVYDALVRMVQDFSLRYPLVDGQGNFGSVDGDPPAAQRYTEAKLERITDFMLSDIEKNTVNFVPNFDSSLEEPSLLPAAIPNLLINGSSGIAVGMATNIPPHNLRETCEGIIHLIDNPDCTIKDLMKKITGPDFPTGGIICGRGGIKSAYETGRGRLLVHAKAGIEEKKGGKESIVITEIPYQVNKSSLIASIAKLVQDKKVEGISNLRDESDKDGMRIVVELKRGQNSQVVLNQLYKHTQMQTTYGVIMLAIVDSRPRVLNLKEALSYYIDHRKEIIVRRTKFDKEKAEARAHILEGLKIALKNLDRIISIIKKSKDPQAAKQELIKKFKLSDRQAQAILEMQLQRLTGLERDKIDAEYKELIKKIEYLSSILASGKKVLSIIKEELAEITKKFGDERRTALMGEAEDLAMEDLIQDEDVVITISHSGYIKRLPVSAYRKQRRGGKGVSGAGMQEEDFIEDLFIASTHDNLLFFTDKGKAYTVKVYDIPQASRTAKGKAIVNMLSISSEEKVTSSISVKKFEEGKFLMMVTRAGKVKKTSLPAFANIRKSGIIAISLSKDDDLVETKLTSEKEEVFIATKEGKAVRFAEKDIRNMGRGAQGVRGINLGKNDSVVGMEVIADKKVTLLSVTENGFSKRTEAQEYRLQSRGGKGIINLKVTAKNGLVTGLKIVSDKDDIMIITDKGMVVRCAVKDIRATGRSAQGVRIIKLDKDDKVATVARVVKEED